MTKATMARANRVENQDPVDAMPISTMASRPTHMIRTMQILLRHRDSVSQPYCFKRSLFLPGRTPSNMTTGLNSNINVTVMVYCIFLIARPPMPSNPTVAVKIDMAPINTLLGVFEDQVAKCVASLPIPFSGPA